MTRSPASFACELSLHTQRCSCMSNSFLVVIDTTLECTTESCSDVHSGLSCVYKSPSFRSFHGPLVHDMRLLPCRDRCRFGCIARGAARHGDRSAGRGVQERQNLCRRCVCLHRRPPRIRTVLSAADPLRNARKLNVTIALVPFAFVCCAVANSVHSAI